MSRPRIKAKPTYLCNSCDISFTWDKNSIWYGSYADQETHPEKVKHYCTHKCAIKDGAKPADL
jgi:hypothetical protein